MGNRRQMLGNKYQIFGYTARVLRVDLTKGEFTVQYLDEGTLRKYVGGSVLGIKHIYDEVPPGVRWSDPENRFFIGSGPLGATRVGGSGSICTVTKGALTNGMGSSQANGVFGAYLRLNGYDAVILHGTAPEWSYLNIHDGITELKDATHLLGKLTWEVEEQIRRELGKNLRDVSVLSIGPAGDHLVRFASVFCDFGHVSAHNGMGAVLGSKKVKAVVVERGHTPVALKDGQALSLAAKKILEFSKTTNAAMRTEGTLPGVIMGFKFSEAPVKNYTRNYYPIAPDILDSYSPAKIMSRFGKKEKIYPCWACSAEHCHRMEIPDGKYQGLIFEEPEAEGIHEFSATVGIEDVTMTMVLNAMVDRLGFDINETGYLMGMVIECYEKGLITKKDTDGLEMTWGNGEAILAMLKKIAFREGFGNILAEGTMRAAQAIGGEAPRFAVHTMKGNTPRGHDHRAVWYELFETCVSNLGTLESHKTAPFSLFGVDPKYDRFDPMMVSTVNARIKGAMVFEDSMVTCRINTCTALDLLCEAVNAVTGWNMDMNEAMAVGKRGVNLARAFNLRHGISADLDRPSERYGSALPDGPQAGKNIMLRWDEMVRNYYHLMGWDEKTSQPLPETLQKLGLDFVIPQLWPGF
jgi:aldehyde:ferredoxin oxidoreductase